MVRLAYFVSHPIQYQVPLLRLIAAEPEIDFKVFFYSDFSLTAYQDEGFGRLIKWDVPLTEGYEYQFLDVWGSKQQRNWLQQPIAQNIYQHLKREKFDAIWVHGWSWFCSLQVVLAADKLGIPIFIRGESNELAEVTHPLKRRLKKVVLDWLFEKMTGFLYIGTLNRQFYKNYGIDDDRLFCVPYAVDNDYFQQRAMSAFNQREELRRTLNLDPGRPIILYAAKLIDVKRPQDLLAAYRLLSADGVQEPDPYLLFVGDGILRPTLEAEAQATNWHSIRFLGFRNQSEMPAMYDLCDVLVLPSDFEPWGLAINEVMNAGKAVIVSDRVGCAADLVIEGQNGRTYPMGDIAALAEVISWAITHHATAGDISRKKIQQWSYQQDIQGLKQALNHLST